MRYHNITHDDMLNGDGLRVVLWVAGCNHQCPECQNPVTWDVEGGIPFDESAMDEIERDLQKDYVSGITFSGGDPLHPQNRAEIEKIMNVVKEKYPLKTIWLYTGYLWEDIKELPMVKNLDVIVDGPFLNDLKDVKLHWRGSSNQRVINVQESLKTDQIVLWTE